MMDTLDILENYIIQNQQVTTLTFCSYPKQVLIQEELKLSESANAFINNALKFRKETDLPFWDSLMLSFFNKKHVPDALLHCALRHNNNVSRIKTNDIKAIRDYLSCNPDANLSLNSEVTIENGGTKHFFMIDFHVRQSENNLVTISKLLKILQLKGYILDSGESYHFISKNLYDLEIIIDLLAKALLFSPLIDRAWVAHQILERSCSLRVGTKHQKKPFLIKDI